MGKNNLEPFTVYGQLDIGIDEDDQLTEINEDGAFALHQFSGSLDSLKSTDLSELKPEIAKAKQTQNLVKSRQVFLTFIGKHIKKASDTVERVKNEILRLTEPPSPTNDIAALRQDLKFREIREYIKQCDPKLRHKLIDGNIDYIMSCVSAPIPFLPDNLLQEYRREYAFKQAPSLVQKEQDAIQRYKTVRKRAAEINSTAVRMMQLKGIDDPLPPKEFFEIFTPQSDHEQVFADRLIQRYDRKIERNLQSKKFDELNKGINLGRDKRAERMKAGLKR
jgi:hypothetical protein